MKPSLYLLGLGCMLVVACADRAPPRVATTTTTSAAVVEPASVECEIDCEGVAVVPQPARTEEPDHHAAAIADADRVIASMHDDLLACYKKRLATNPRARGFVSLDIVIEESGRVRSVDATGGGMLGEAALKCITSRVSRSSFAPVHGGGTLRLQVPLTLRTMGAGESI